MRILFLQLARLENDAGGIRENLPMAGFYFQHQMARAGMGSGYEVRFLTPEEKDLDDRHLLGLIVDWRPDIICATLYLWNIERTLHLLKNVRGHLGAVKIIAGGPEVSSPHPFLFKSRIPDAAVVGEGEAVFPGILRALKQGARTNFRQVAWKTGNAYVWGHEPAPLLALDRCLPSPKHPGWKPDVHGMAYLETGRGCPMHCTYCRYGHLRRRTTFIRASQVKHRVQTLMDRGAREIRFVDPVFNANPEFRRILLALREINRGNNVRFFAEIQADLLNTDVIGLLAEAGFSVLEAGVQSLDPQVLRRIRRPVRHFALEENLRRLTQKGIRVTIDLMYGLPGQTREDVEASLQWASGFKRAHVQCFQTLLLPGTALRSNRRHWKTVSHHLPPYGVHATGTLSPEDIRDIEGLILRRFPADCMTRKFVGKSLPDLFKERIPIAVPQSENIEDLRGMTSRRALVFRGPNLFIHRRIILQTLRHAIASEPHMLWQFVLEPPEEEPLDLVEQMVTEIRRHPSHWIDRFASVSAWERVASRRIFILLKRSDRFSPSWIEAAEDLLEDHFF